MKEELYKLGFTDYIHLREEYRDDKKRKTWSGVYKDMPITFRIVFSNNNWEIEKILFDSMDDKLARLYEEKDISNTITFIKNYCNKY